MHVTSIYIVYGNFIVTLIVLQLSKVNSMQFFRSSVKMHQASENGPNDFVSAKTYMCVQSVT